MTAGTAGIATVLFACEQGAPQASAAVVETPTPEGGTGTGLYDGSPVPPLSSEPIMNPDGLQDRPLGGVDANVVLIEYISPTCPVCASFHATVYPRLKETYIDTGRIVFIGRPFIRNVLDAVVFMLAEASGTAYYPVLETFLATQNQWAAAESPRQAMFSIAQQFGFTQERFEEILTDEEMFARLESMREQALDQFGLTGTPTFYINGDRLSGNASFETLSAEIEQRA